MSNFTDFISSGGGGGLYGGVLMEIPLSTSQTFVPPRNGTVNIICIGGGGGGGILWNDAQGLAAGGGAGGYCVKESLAVTTSSSFTVTIGATGSGTLSQTAADGVTGGNTTVSGTGLSATLTANGGAGGSTETTSGLGLAGGAGGTASNGTVNRTGGAGGSVGENVTTGANLRAATGGGAVAILTSVGYPGGGIFQRLPTSGSAPMDGDAYYATGGAGIGGRGGGLHNINDNNADTLLGCNGGGANHAGYDKTDQYDWVPSSVTSMGRNEAFTFPYVGASLIGQNPAIGGSGEVGDYACNGGGGSAQANNRDDNAFYSGGLGGDRNTNTMGAGGGGWYGNNAGRGAGHGGAFAGGGGTGTYSGSALGVRCGDAGVGGGGGAFFRHGGQALGLSGYGGPGMVFIHYTAYS